MSGYRHPRMDDDRHDLRTLNDAQSSVDESRSMACRGQLSCKNCRRRTGCSCPCHQVAS